MKFIATTLIILIASVAAFKASLSSTLSKHNSVKSSASSSIIMSANVGFIGLGIMGMGMSKRLLGGGHALNVWNRSKDKCDQLKSEYGEKVNVCDSPAAAIAASDVTFIMLSTPEAMKSVYEQPDGILAGVSAGKRLVDCATVTPEDMIWAKGEVSKRGGSFVEAPVSGSKVPAETGALIFLAAGNQDVITSSAPYFALMGKATHNLGEEVGAGSRMKLIVNSIMGNMLACLAEGLHLNEASGLSGSTLLEVISQGAIATPMFALKGPKMLSGEHPPNFPLRHAWKDLRFASQLSKQLGVESTMTDTAADIYKRAAEMGLEDADFAAIAEVGKKKK